MKKNNKKVLKKTEPQKENIVIQNCEFYGVKWDELSNEILRDVSKALLNITQLFKSQNVEIKSLLEISNESPSIRIGSKHKDI